MRSLVLDILERTRDDLREIGIDTSTIRQNARGGFSDKQTLNTLSFVNFSTAQDQLRGKHVSSIFIDNVYEFSPQMRDHMIEFYHSVSVGHGTKIYQIQSGMSQTSINTMEERDSTIRIPIYIDLHYSSTREMDLINKIGSSKYATEYLLKRD
jgi:hypothetical protein